MDSCHKLICLRKVEGKNSLYLSCSRQQPCQSEVPDMQQLSWEIIIEQDLLLHFNTKLLCTVSVLIKILNLDHIKSVVCTLVNYYLFSKLYVCTCFAYEPHAPQNETAQSTIDSFYRLYIVSTINRSTINHWHPYI